MTYIGLSPDFLRIMIRNREIEIARYHRTKSCIASEDEQLQAERPQMERLEWETRVMRDIRGKSWAAR
jgi:hypothetical protein